MATEEIHTDQTLLARLSDGDRQAFEVIYRRYAGALLQAAVKRLDARADAEDLVQEVFYRLWDRRASLQVENLGAYLHTAVRYEVLSHIARNRSPLSFYAPFEAMLLESETPEDRLIAKELLELIYSYAETLPGKRRQVFLLHIKTKLSVKEIAEALDISAKTVHNHLGTAMNGLRTHITPAVLFVLAVLR